MEYKNKFSFEVTGWKQTKLARVKIAQRDTQPFVYKPDENRQKYSPCSDRWIVDVSFRECTCVYIREKNRICELSICNINNKRMIYTANDQAHEGDWDKQGDMGNIGWTEEETTVHLSKKTHWEMECIIIRQKKTR